jgi:hypothetical protein
LIFAFSSPTIYTASAVAMLVFCQCGSHRVDITNGNVNRPRLHCFTRGRAAWRDGFLISEFDATKLSDDIGRIISVDFNGISTSPNGGGVVLLTAQSSRWPTVVNCCQPCPSQSG